MEICISDGCATEPSPAFRTRQRSIPATLRIAPALMSQSLLPTPGSEQAAQRGIHSVWRGSDIRCLAQTTSAPGSPITLISAVLHPTATCDAVRLQERERRFLAHLLRGPKPESSATLFMTDRI